METQEYMQFKKQYMSSAWQAQREKKQTRKLKNQGENPIFKKYIKIQNN